ncbi:uncharacterized protein LOC123388177 isoform X2 [Mustela putorius furo]|uniref:Uncharacterized protein LOC123388177 isoform X2 n=1 Tax=Mustela putorius furo TaxID=9669 RepID=A0A8U0REP5_MUSPF|nr:uncharacterized protein LOC123388177 isoform X2 [Mustela putorius furo]
MAGPCCFGLLEPALPAGTEGPASVMGDSVSPHVRVLRPRLNALLVFTGGASRLRGRGLLGSIQSVWPLSLQCRWKCSTSRSVTTVISLVHVHRSEPKLIINPEGTIVYIHSVKSIMSKLNIYRSHTWTSLPPRLRAEKEHIPGRVPGWQEKWAWSLGQPSKMGGALRLRGRGLLGSIKSVWLLSLQCRWKCSTSRSVTAVDSLVHVHRSGVEEFSHEWMFMT